jgi:hypothetical protein
MSSLNSLACSVLFAVFRHIHKRLKIYANYRILLQAVFVNCQNFVANLVRDKKNQELRTFNAP